MPGKDTKFSPLWIDRLDAKSVLEAKMNTGVVSKELSDRLFDLIEYGYTILRGAISEELADRLTEEMSSVSRNPEAFIARRDRDAYLHPTQEVVDDARFRLIDFHVNSTQSHKAIYASKIDRLLQAVFARPANAFQCLTFMHGSQQAMHQDGAYVAVSEPLQFLASWIALEDVIEGNGELMYYAGSNHLDDFLFPGGSKSWVPDTHGEAVHQQFLRSIVERSKAQDMPYQTFLPKKGDALIWSADLVHGGTVNTRGGTRRSMVSHYCPIDVKPKFSTFTQYFHLRQVAENGYISSRHYDLRPKLFTRRLWSSKVSLLKPKFMGRKGAKPH